MSTRFLVACSMAFLFMRCEVGLASKQVRPGHSVQYVCLKYTTCPPGSLCPLPRCEIRGRIEVKYHDEVVAVYDRKTQRWIKKDKDKALDALLSVVYHFGEVQ